MCTEWCQSTPRTASYWGWNGEVSGKKNTTLPFGLQLAPQILTALADALMWIMYNHGMLAAIHYLDNYFIIGDPHTQECYQALQSTLSLCEQLGVPVSKAKVEGPSMVLVLLGILLDTVKYVLRLPDKKLARLNRLITEWSKRKSCVKRDLLSLIGYFQHACKVVCPGRSFLRRMIELSMVAKEVHHHIGLTA